ncbi:uncharacterized protein LOC134295936 [Anolis carolinensis]|uniref:uncharacterized protein LOC134295936 n=1 Tax=Anolis carolinensis TaxID=28377 RepID=UPI002F2B4E1C
MIGPPYYPTVSVIRIIRCSRPHGPGCLLEGRDFSLQQGPGTLEKPGACCCLVTRCLPERQDSSLQQDFSLRQAPGLPGEMIGPPYYPTVLVIRIIRCSRPHGPGCLLEGRDSSLQQGPGTLEKPGACCCLVTRCLPERQDSSLQQDFSLRQAPGLPGEMIGPPYYPTVSVIRIIRCSRPHGPGCLLEGRDFSLQQGPGTLEKPGACCCLVTRCLPERQDSSLQQDFSLQQAPGLPGEMIGPPYYPTVLVIRIIRCSRPHGPGCLLEGRDSSLQQGPGTLEKPGACCCLVTRCLPERQDSSLQQDFSLRQAPGLPGEMIGPPYYPTVSVIRRLARPFMSDNRNSTALSK